MWTHYDDGAPWGRLLLGRLALCCTPQGWYWTLSGAPWWVAPGRA
jgi:hypothetical protein